MLTSPRIPCVRRNAIPVFSAAGTSWPRRRLFTPPRNLGLAARTTRTRCFDWEDEGSDLEAEILEFMKSSSKPESFPTRIELVEAGRVDLAEAVVSRGGWLSFGWDSETEEEIGNNGAWNDNNNDDDDKDCSNFGEAKLHDEEASSILSLYPYANNETEYGSTTLC